MIFLPGDDCFDKKNAKSSLKLTDTFPGAKDKGQISKGKEQRAKIKGQIAKSKGQMANSEGQKAKGK